MADVKGEHALTNYGELLRIVREHRVQEALSAGRDWSVYFHFSPERANLLRWYPFSSGQQILELGAGCGALTGFLSELADGVVAVEPDAAARQVLQARFEGQQAHIDVRASFSEADSSLLRRFSYVVLVGVRNAAAFFVPAKTREEDAFLSLLRSAAACLARGGHLLIAVPNRLGMRYFAGAPDAATGVPFAGVEGYSQIGSKTARMFSRAELSGLLEEAGLVSCSWYYPYPDEMFTDQVFSDDRLPEPADFYAETASYETERLATFDERCALQSLRKEEFPLFSNSFFVDCQKGELDS